MTQLFSYILPNDSGMAPCIADGLITLATCKPRIRASAHVRYYVAGFHSISLKKNWSKGRLIWMGRVAETLSIGDYERKYQGRSDAIYRKINDDAFLRLRPGYHDNAHAIRKDLNGNVLVFDTELSWYFGGNKPLLLADEFISLSAQGIGHRIAKGAPVHSLVAWMLDRGPPSLDGQARDPIKLSAGASQPIVVLPSVAGEDEPALVRRRMQKLAAFLPVFTQPGFSFGRWPKAVSNEQGFQLMHSYAYSAEADAFIQAAYIDFAIENASSVRDYSGTLEGERLRCDPQALTGADADQLLWVLAQIVRSERFCDGAVASAFEEGFLTRICERAAALTQTLG